jgi:fibronectin-binding autotransporter adhesin
MDARSSKIKRPPGRLFLISAFLLGFVLWTLPASLIAATGVPKIISYQGRLTDASGTLLGGNGTTYYFKFSIWNNPTVGLGSQLWPSASPSVASSTVSQGVFNVNIGDTANNYPDPLTYDFYTSSDAFLQVEVATSSVGTYETLAPRQRIGSAGSAITADTVTNRIDSLGQGNLATTTIASLTIAGTSTFAGLSAHQLLSFTNATGTALGLTSGGTALQVTAGASILQGLTFTNATGTSASITSVSGTNLNFATATTTNLRATAATSSVLSVTGGGTALQVTLGTSALQGVTFTNATGTALNVSNDATVGGTLTVGGIVGSGALTIQSGGTNALSLISGSTALNLTAANTPSATGTIKIADSNIFTLGSRSSAPTGIANGSLYYDTTMNKLRCFENGLWTSCIGSGGGGGGNGSDLQSAYATSTDPEITLLPSLGGISILDNVTPVNGNLFEIQNNARNVNYLAVSSSSVTLATSTINGNINIAAGGVLKIGGTMRIDAIGQATLATSTLASLTVTGTTTLATTTASSFIVTGSATLMNNVSAGSLGVSGTSSFGGTAGFQGLTFTNATGTSANIANIIASIATTTNLGTANLTIGTLSGFLKAANGIVGTALSTDYVSSTQAGTGITVNQTTGAVTITNNGVLSFNGATGTVTFDPYAQGFITATSTAFIPDAASSSFARNANNLSDLTNTSTARTNLGVKAGTGLTFDATNGFVNNGVLSNIAGAGIAVSSATGSVTITNTQPHVTTTINGLTQNTFSFTAGAGLTLATSGPGTITYANNGVLSLAGTTNQVSASSATGTITLSLPQDINTGALNFTVSGATTTNLQFTNATGTTLFATSVTSTNLKTTNLLLGNASGLLQAANGTVGAAASNQYVSSTAAGAGIVLSGSTGAVTITNNGVLSLIAGTDITVSSATGTITIANAFPSSTYLKVANNLSDLNSSSTARTNLGVRAGTGLTFDATNGFVNNGVLSNIAGAGITVSSATGSVTIANNGVLSFNGATGTVTFDPYAQGFITATSTAFIPNVASSSFARVANNLGDLTSTATARTNLGVKAGTGLTYDATNGFVNNGVLSLLAGTDITVSSATGTITIANAFPSSTYLKVANNLSDLTNTSTARTNIGFSAGTGLTLSSTGIFANNGVLSFNGATGTVTFDPYAQGFITATSTAFIPDAASSSFARNANNLSDLTNTSTARTNLGVRAGTGLTFDATNGFVNNGVLSIAGTANQVSASSATGTVTLSLPQDINTGALNFTVSGATTTNLQFTNATGTTLFATNVTSTNIKTTNLTISGITGTIQCLHVDTNGVVTGTNSDCGSGTGTTNPGGSGGQIQFNNGGSFGGDALLTWSTTTQLFAVNGTTTLATTTISALTVSGISTFTGTVGFQGLNFTSATGTTLFATSVTSTNLKTTNLLLGNVSGLLQAANGTVGAAASNQYVSSTAAGAGIVVNQSTGAVTITNNGVLSLAGTPNQIFASSATGTITLSLPQNISATATPTFASATLSNFSNGSLLFSTSSGIISQDNSSLFWDSVNRRLGIGTSTPAFPLAIVGTTSIYSSANAETLRLRQDGDIQQMVNGTFCIRDFSGNCFLNHSNSSLITINNALSGGVVISPQMSAGIAVSASSTWTSSTTAITGLFVNIAHTVNQKGTSTQNRRFAIDAEVDNKSIFVVHEQGTVGVGTSTPVTLFTIASSTSANNFFNVTDTGNVGIGTTTPATVLDVNGATTLRSGLTLSSFGSSGCLSLGSGGSVSTSSCGGVTSVIADTGITVSSATGTVTIANSGVLSLIAGTDITVSSATGTITVGQTYASSAILKVANNLSDLNSSSTARTNLGVRAGTGLTFDATNGFVNNGVLSNIAGAGITVSSATGSVTVANNGVLSVANGGNINLSSATGTVTLWFNPSLATATITNLAFTSATGSLLNIANVTTTNLLATLLTTTNFAGTNSTSSNLSLSASGTPALYITGLPQATSTKSLVRFGPFDIVGGNSSGTLIGGNFTTTTGNDFLNFQVNSSSIFKVDVGGQLNAATTTVSGLTFGAGSGTSLTLSASSTIAGLNFTNATGTTLFATNVTSTNLKTTNLLLGNVSGLLQAANGRSRWEPQQVTSMSLRPPPVPASSSPVPRVRLRLRITASSRLRTAATSIPLPQPAR